MKGLQHWPSAKHAKQNSKTVLRLFQENFVAFCIPLYQREYSWDTENIGNQ
jgi:uncharacterized protein with ParB-like and HNH nuclease domain